MNFSPKLPQRCSAQELAGCQLWIRLIQRNWSATWAEANSYWVTKNHIRKSITGSAPRCYRKRSNLPCDGRSQIKLALKNEKKRQRLNQRKAFSTNAFASCLRQLPCATISLSKSHESSLARSSRPSCLSVNDNRTSKGTPPF